MAALEQAWMPMRISITTIWNRPYTLEWTARAWIEEWKKPEQDKIREWAMRTIIINQLVIEHKRGNEFHG